MGQRMCGTRYRKRVSGPETDATRPGWAVRRGKALRAGILRLAMSRPLSFFPCWIERSLFILLHTFFLCCPMTVALQRPVCAEKRPMLFLQDANMRNNQLELLRYQILDYCFRSRAPLQK